jgi:hypothetical protein
MGDFEGFFVREHPRVLATCAALAGDLDSAAEATDEAFARAFARWETVEGMIAPGGWVQTVAINQLRRFHRRRRLEMHAPKPHPVEHLPDLELWFLALTTPRSAPIRGTSPFQPGRSSFRRWPNRAATPTCSTSTSSPAARCSKPLSGSAPTP